MKISTTQRKTRRSSGPAASIDGPENAQDTHMKPRSNRHSKQGGCLAACILIGFAASWLSPAECQTPVQEPPMPEGYRIGAGDVLQIDVWKEPEASVSQVMVRADGKIALPLVGEVVAAGFTPAELKASLVDKLLEYIKSPSVTVLAKEIHSRRVYVVGTVKKEGPILLLRPMTILQAINEAGGLGEFANKKKIYVLRAVNGKQEKLPFNYTSVIKGNHLEQNIVLLPDDTIVVP
jgi:polysaccharide biosynthesis/export protein